MASDSYAAFVRKHEDWNFWVNVLDLGFYAMAGSFIFGSTVLSLYGSYLTSSRTLIGLVAAVQNVGYYLPQLVWAHKTELLPRKKPLLMRVSVLERVPYLLVTLGILFWPRAPWQFSYLVLLLSLGLATFSGGLVGPAWQGMLAKVMPAQRRGRMFGMGQALGGLLGLAGAAISRQALARYTFPASFGLCFFFAFIAQAVSWTCLSLNREAPMPSSQPTLSARDYLKRLPAILRANHNFSRYLAARALVVLGSMANGFYVLYARQRYAIGDAYAAVLTMVALASQTVSNPLLGWVADRSGWKFLTELCTLLALAAVMVVLWAPGIGWLYAVFALMNMAMSGMSLAAMGMPMEFAGEDDLPTLVALANALLAAPVLLAPILGGWLADAAGYRVLFWVSSASLLAGWAAMRWGVREPRKA